MIAASAPLINPSSWAPVGADTDFTPRDGQAEYRPSRRARGGPALQCSSLTDSLTRREAGEAQLSRLSPGQGGNNGSTSFEDLQPSSRSTQETPSSTAILGASGVSLERISPDPILRMSSPGTASYIERGRTNDLRVQPSSDLVSVFVEIGRTAASHGGG